MRSFLLILGVFVSFVPQLWGQNSCQCTIKGRINSKENKEEIQGAYIYLKGQNKSTQSDSKGNFNLKNICPGTYTLICEMSSFDRVEMLVTLEDHEQKEENISLEVHDEHLMEVLVSGKRSEGGAQLKGKLSDEERAQRDGLSLGEMMKGIVGVQSLQTGSTISKPVIHGMHSSRVIILNQGVRQEGQNWGSEHAPEVDPFVAKNIQVIKGPAGLRYGGDAIGGIVMLEPNALPDSALIRGEVQSIFFTNGRQFVGSALLEGGIKNVPGFGWRLQGTLKNGGNMRTATYYLANTGIEEQNFSAAMGYKTNRWSSDLFFSRFHSIIGIYSGSHIGNVNDLEKAIQRPRPFEQFTPTEFIREIERPNQDIVHNLGKWKSLYRLPSGSAFRGNIAFQQDRRLELDVLRMGKNINTLRFELETISGEFLFDETNSSKKWKGQFGLNLLSQGNITSGNRVNRPTLTTSLLPNYYLTNFGLFALERFVNEKIEIDGGLRLDAKNIEIHRPDMNYSTRINRNDIDYFGLSGSLGMKYHWSEQFENHLILARAFRAPGANELYSNGVHHGAGAYEIGNPNLRGETAYNISLNTLYTVNQWAFEVGLYANSIHDFIYLKPLVERGRATYVTTVRGSFPAFAYEQIDATFKGVDAQVNLKASERWSFQQKTSLVYAFDEKNHVYMVNIPANRYEYLIRHQFPKNKHYVSVGLTQVARQTRVEKNSDYSPPPAGYFLLEANWGMSIKAFDMGISVNNALNQAYRDYLNRFRYYADDQGINVSLRLSYRFS